MCRCVTARSIDDIGWVANDYLGIDQGPIVAMIENYRSGLIWKIMQKQPTHPPWPAASGIQRRLAASSRRRPATSVTSSER